MQEKSTLNIKCQGCHRDTALNNIKKVGTRRLCPICYSYIISTLNGGKPLDNVEDIKSDDGISKKSDDEGSKRLKRVMKNLKIKNNKYENRKI
jgi:hypothetical protein